MGEYYAHISEDGRYQSIRSHLQETADCCASFAKVFGAEMQGKFIGQLHDIGKYSSEFQRRLQGGPKVDHSTAGALESAKASAEWGAFCIAGHHSGLPDGGCLNTDLAGDPTLFGRLKKGITGGIPNYIKNWDGFLLKVDSPPKWGQNPLSDSFMIRMLYSCLVDADYLKTEYFMKNGVTGRGKYDTLATLSERLNQYISPWWTPTNELNALRCEILKNCMDASQDKKGLYSLTVPTGGGKTIASMAFAINHAKKHSMSHIIYVIPYTSIIEQNAEVFRTIFGNENVIEHHSDFLFDIEEGTDDHPCSQALATENWDAPIIVTTAVQFFESLYANRASQCRKLHNIANSVIIFDEVQMLPTFHLRPCVAAVSELVKNFGSTAVLCTATQPVLNDLFSEYTNGMIPQEICREPSEFFQKFRRVSFRIAGKISSSALTKELSNLSQVLCIVNTRKTAQLIYTSLPRNGSYHLSTLMCPKHRRKILNEIKERLKSGLPCRVISTSLIEAGVDVDFPAVYREITGLDSILQAAGRCNREGKRNVKESVVTVFEGEDSPPPLLKVNIGATYEVLNDGIDFVDPQTIEQYFSAYRSLADKKLDKYGIISAFEKGISGCLFPFKTIGEKFHLIDNATKTIYIPLNEGAEIIERIKNGEHSNKLYREAGQFSVNVYEQHYNNLLSAGDILPISEDSAVLVNPDLYSSETGLSLSADMGKCLFG